MIELATKKRSIDEITDELISASGYNSREAQKALRSWCKKKVRSVISKTKGKDGFPLILSVTDVDDQGNETPRFMQWRLFDVIDLQKSVEKLARKKRYYAGFEKTVRKYAREKYPDEAVLF